MSLLPIFFGTLLIFSSVVLVAAGRLSSEEKALQVRIADIRNPRRTLQAEAEKADFDDEQSKTLSRRLTLFLERYWFSSKIESLLLEADSTATVGAFLLTCIRSASAGAILGVVLSRSIAALFFGCIAGIAFPVMKLKRRKAKRLKAVSRGLADAADLMARALRAGHSMTQAIEVLAEQAPQPLAAEFSRVFQQQKLGVPLRDVLLEFCRRVPSKDIQFLITAILVQRETGGDLVQILDRTTNVLRERIRVQGEVQVYTAQGRMTAWILSLLPVGLLCIIYIFSHDYARVLFDDPTGRTLLYAGAVSILVGSLIIRRIVKVTF